MPAVSFYVLGAAAIVASLLVITRPNPIHSALFLLIALFAMAGIFLVLHAEFVAAVQILVYAGGVLILYLFVVMLMDLGRDMGDLQVFQSQWAWAALVGALFCGLVLVWLGGGVAAGPPGDYAPGVVEQVGGNPKAFGRELFTTFLYPFEVVSLVLIVAMIGAVILTRKDRDDKQAVAESRGP